MVFAEWQVGQVPWSMPWIQEHAPEQAEHPDAAFRRYVRRRAGSDTTDADERERLAGSTATGTLTAAELEHATAKVLQRR